MTDAATPAAVAAPDAGWTRAQVWALLAITLLATALRLWRIEQWSWSDAEATTWRALTGPLGGDRGLFASGEGLAPLGHLLLRAATASGLLPGHGEGWLRLPFGFAGAIVVPLLAVLGRPLVGAAAALLAALLLALHPLHIALSQSTQPLGLAVLAGVGGMLALRAGARRLAAIAFVLAGACAPLGWVGAATALLLRLDERRIELVAGAAAVLFALTSPWTWSALGPAPICLAIVGWAAPVAPALRVAAIVPLAATGVAAVLGHGVQLALAVPGLLLLAAAGALQIAAIARSTLRGSAGASTAVAGLGAGVVVCWLAVDAFLYFTVYRGARAPWRNAADAVWVAANGPGGFVVGAAAGVPSLRCYLRPNHWRDPDVDAHPGVAVLPLALDEPGAAASLATLLARSERRALAVLRADELDELPPPARVLLDEAFELLRVVPSAQRHGESALYVFRRASAR